MKRHATKAALGLSVTLAIAVPVFAAKGGKPEPTTGTPATLAYADRSGDGIQSDGGGAYSGTIDGQVVVIETGKRRSIFLDFSTCLTGIFDGPFGNSLTGDAAGARLTIRLADRTAILEFQGTGEYALFTTDLAVLSFDDDSDGTIDRYVVETTGGDVHGLCLRTKKGGRGFEPGTVRFVCQGAFSMPWRVEIAIG